MPRGKLQYRIKYENTKQRKGPATYLTTDEENVIVDWINESYKKGFPNILLSVKMFLDSSTDKRYTPFTDNMPGRGWYQMFLARHPNISIRKPEAVTAASGNVSETNIKNWFNDIEKYLKEENYFSILKDPMRVYNGDETNFLLCPKKPVV